MSSGRTRTYVEEYHRISAKTFRYMLKANPGFYKITNGKLSKEHQKFLLVHSRNSGRVIIFNFHGCKCSISLKLDNRSASNKLYLVCPECSKPRQHLYAVSNAYICRSCLQLNYACQSERKLARLARKIRKQRQNIWGADWPGLNNLCDSSFLWPKPKWMRFNTFEASTAKLRLLEEQYLKQSLKQFEKMFGAIHKQTN